MAIISGVEWEECKITKAGTATDQEEIGSCVRSVDISDSIAEQMTSAINTATETRAELREDLEITLNGFLDDVLTNVFLTGRRKARTVTLKSKEGASGTKQVEIGATMMITAFNPNLSDSGEFTWSATFKLASGPITMQVNTIT